MVVGATGKMGREVCRYLMNHDKYELAAAVDVCQVSEDIGTVTGSQKAGVYVKGTITEALSDASIDMAIDFTHIEAARTNILECIRASVSVLVGTTGFNEEEKKQFNDEATQKNISVLIVPNFSISALLMMNFSRIAAKYMHSAEIIEMHHPQKLDKPSGTALMTKNIILDSFKDNNIDTKDVETHSVRLPGLVAHQSVIFGDQGNTLTIRQDSYDRISFMPGVGMGLEKLGSFTGLKTGLQLDDF